jgi:hypothetical protein
MENSRGAVVAINADSTTSTTWLLHDQDHEHRDQFRIFVLIQLAGSWSLTTFSKENENENAKFNRQLVSDSVFPVLWLECVWHGHPGHYPGTPCPWRRRLYFDRQVKTSQ